MIIFIPKLILFQNHPFFEKILLAYNQFLRFQGAVDGNQLLIDSFRNRLLNPGTWITLFFLISFVMLIIGKSRFDNTNHKSSLRSQH